MEITFMINGEERTEQVKPNQRLLDLIRKDLGLVGAKEGCGKGECGACTVLLNQNPVASCLVLAAQVDGAEILTVEGLGSSTELHPLQEAFLEAGAVQCGFCIPGTIMTAYSLLQENPDPTRQDIRQAIAGNICRCTGYQKIVDAVELAAKKMAAGGEG
ncbi:MAG: (2Fe-2S)-binding protein [Bacillota bacterium]